MMQLSKIGSKNTYHKCLKELHVNGYIMYHPSHSKFHPVKISMLRLDTNEEESKFRQLDLFAQDPPKNQESASLQYLEKEVEERIRPDDNSVPSGIISGTDSVPDMTGSGLNIDTGTVPKLGHSLKQNLKQKNSVQNTPNKIFEKNKEIQNKINRPPFKESTQRGAVNEKHRVSNMGHIKPNITFSEVEEFFKQNQYPIKEAQKFFYYNQGKNWMLTDKIPITDWKALANKWMLNAKTTDSENLKEIDLKKDIQFVYDLLLEGKPISKAILIEHYEFLKLQLTDEVLAEAWQRRINQLSGSNENAKNLLLQAYERGDKTNKLLIHDEPNFIALAKRVAVFNYLKKLQQEGKLNVIDKD